MTSMHTSDRPKLLPSQHDGLAIASLVFAVFFPILGIIFGTVAISSSHRDGRQASGLAITATILSPIICLLGLIIIISVTHSSPPVCDLNNPAWPNC